MHTIVVGAGLAGLSAALTLVEGGREVTVLEARTRLGGRVWSEPLGDSVAELGPEWFDPGGPVAELLGQAGARVTLREGARLQRTVRGWEPSEQMGAAQTLLERLGRLAGPDLPLTESLRSNGSSADLAVALQTLIPYVEGFHAADPDRVSTRWLQEVEANASAADSDGRTPDGLGRAVEELVRRLAGRATIRTGCRVREIRWRTGVVEIGLEDSPTPLAADAAIITLPLGVLKAGAVTFLPPLPDKQGALDRLEMGEVRKVVLEFQRRFWETAEVPRALFMQDYQQPIPTWWLPASPTSPTLIGWAGGPRAVRVDGGPGRTAELALTSLAGLLALPRGTVEREVTRVWYHDWSSDPFSLGAYSYVQSGGSDAPALLARPVADTLYFAGEATVSHGANATMDGAVESGRRAGREVLGGGD